MSWEPEDGDISEDDGSDMDYDRQEDAQIAQAEAMAEMEAERRADVSEADYDRAEDAYLDNLHGHE
jgi:hypothetical protein